MNEPKMISEREAVLREREAFVAGVVAVHRARKFGSDAVAMAFISCDQADTAEGIAAKQYPLPKVTRPRVVNDPISAGAQWRVSPESGCIEYRWQSLSGNVGYSWGRAIDYRNCADIVPLPERVAVWHDLLANPTEEVEADS